MKPYEKNHLDLQNVCNNSSCDTLMILHLICCNVCRDSVRVIKGVCNVICITLYKCVLNPSALPQPLCAVKSVVGCFSACENERASVTSNLLSFKCVFTPGSAHGQEVMPCSRKL